MPDQPKRKHLPRIPVWLPLEQPVVYLVTACCAERRRIFADANAVVTGVGCLQQTAQRHSWTIWKVCFMPDHVHQLASPGATRDQRLSDFMRAWKSCVTIRLRQRGLPGEVWQCEFHDRLLRSDEKADEKWEYVRQNPVRAGLCKEPEEYPFSGTPAEIIARLQPERRDT